MIRVNLELIRAGAAELAQYRDDDEQAYLDTLDGETDVADVLDALILEDSADAAMIEAVKRAEDRLRMRRDRIGARRDKRREVMARVLDAAELSKAVVASGSISVRDGAMSVRITDEADVPRQLCTIKEVVSPDKKAIKAQIEAGVDVPGAILVRGDRSVTVRVA